MATPYIENLLGEKEQIILVTRQHWFILFRDILLEIVVILAITGFTVALSLFVPALLPWSWLGLILIIFPAVGLVHDLLEWIFRQYIVTNRRVVQTAGIINKHVTDSSLEKVNDVKLEQSFWGRIFNFGTVEILTASELGVNVFKYIGDPVRFKTAMLNAKEVLSDGDDGTKIANPPRPRGIPELINELDDLRMRGILTEEEFQRKKEELLSRI